MTSPSVAMAMLDLSEEEWDALPHKVQEYLMRQAPSALPDRDYTLAEGAAWFTVGKISVRLHKTDARLTRIRRSGFA